MLYWSCKAPDPQNGTQRQARNKQSAPWENGAMMCKNLFGDSIREGVSYPLFTQVLLPLRLPRHPQQCPSLLWPWHLIHAFRLFDTIVLRTEVAILEKCFSRAWMLLLIRVHVLGNRLFFDSTGADSRWRRCHPPLHSPLPQVWGWSCRCVWGKRGLRKSFRALTPGQHQATSFDVHENFSPYFLPGWYFSHFWSDYFLVDSKSWNSFGSKSNRFFHFT